MVKLTDKNGVPVKRKIDGEIYTWSGFATSRKADIPAEKNRLYDLGTVKKIRMIKFKGVRRRTLYTLFWR